MRAPGGTDIISRQDTPGSAPGRRTRAAWLAAGAAAAAVLGATPPVAHAHGAAAHARLSEAALVRLETRLLGSAHAAEHRRARAWERRAAARWARLTPSQRRRARAAARTAAAGDPATEGRWLAPFEMPVVGVHAALLPTGKVMFFSQKVNDYRSGLVAAHLWDPARRPGEPGEFESVPPPANIWCGGQSLMADGQLLVAGGNLDFPRGGLNYKGLNTVFTFDPWAKTWTRQPDMTHGRWYPTQTLLPDGRTLITSGYDEGGALGWNVDIDVFNPPATRGGQGSITTIARYGEIANSPRLPQWYPHWFVMPSGGVLNAGFSRSQSWLLNPAPGAVSAEDRPNWSAQRKYGTAVLAPGTPAGSTHVMQVGGYDHTTTEKLATATAEVFDEAAPQTPPVAAPSLQVPRANHNTVLLPDRSMVTVGGGGGEGPGVPDAAGGPAAPDWTQQRAIEIRDPVTGAWRLGPSQVYKRAYHSTALLLPDGRVLSAGDDRDPARGPTYVEKDRAEIYEPPYLFAPGPRPAIVRAPGGVAYGERFGVDTSDPIASAVLMAPGATTHANDMHQRFVQLDIAPRPDGRGAALAAPPNPNVAPPGYYMLFVLGPTGKPSVATWVYVGQSRAAPPVQPDATTRDGREPASKDTRAPRMTVRAATTLRRLRRTGRLRLRITANEAATATVSARLRVKRSRSAIRVPRRGGRRLTLARAQTRTIALRLRPAARRQIARRRPRTTVRLRSRDRAGNVGAQTFAVKLRR
jgi:hypothetical protein